MGFPISIIREGRLMLSKWPLWWKVLATIGAFIVGLSTVIGTIYTMRAYRFSLKPPTQTTTQPTTSNQSTNLANKNPKKRDSNNSIHSQKPPAAAKKNSPKVKASDLWAKQQVERWRKEIQSFAHGDNFNKNAFMDSTTFTQMYPHLSSETMRELNDPVIKIIVPLKIDSDHPLGSQRKIIGNEVLMLLYKDLDNISAK
jgi:hypothetical protein